MNRQTALSILGLNTSATDDEIKKQFRKLAKENHPDRGGDENEYKKISEAFEYLKSSKNQDNTFVRNDFINMPFQINVEDIFNYWKSQETQSPPEPVVINLELSFKESVLGCQKKIEINRRTKCKDCSGNGFKVLNDTVCPTCNGLGRISKTNGAVTIFSICPTCKAASVKREICNTCNGKAGTENISKFDIKLRGGLTNGNFVRLPGAGHYFKIMNTDQFGEVLLNVKVKPEKNMILNGKDVISTIKISLLEALTGTSIKVKTVMGESDLIISPKTKHKDQVVLPKLGVEQVGNHIFMIEVDYPDNISNIIDILKKESENV